MHINLLKMTSSEKLIASVFLKRASLRTGSLTVGRKLGEGVESVAHELNNMDGDPTHVLKILNSRPHFSKPNHADTITRTKIMNEHPEVFAPTRWVDKSEFPNDLGVGGGLVQPLMIESSAEGAAAYMPSQTKRTLYGLFNFLTGNIFKANPYKGTMYENIGRGLQRDNRLFRYAGDNYAMMDANLPVDQGAVRWFKNLVDESLENSDLTADSLDKLLTAQALMKKFMPGNNMMIDPVTRSAVFTDPAFKRMSKLDMALHRLRHNVAGPGLVVGGTGTAVYRGTRPPKELKTADKL